MCVWGGYLCVHICVCIDVCLSLWRYMYAYMRRYGKIGNVTLRQTNMNKYMNSAKKIRFSQAKPIGNNRINI